MSHMNSNGERLRRATQLWHAYLASTGLRFELVKFLKDPALEQQVIDGSLASGDQKLISLAQDWLRDTGRAAPGPAAAPARARTAASAPPAAQESDPPKPGRYLRGVR